MTDGRESPRRLRAADVIDQLNETIERLTTKTATEPSASVELSRNAKGEVQFTTKAYATLSSTDAEMEAVTSRAFDHATNSFDALSAKYPFGGS